MMGISGLYSPEQLELQASTTRAKYTRIQSDAVQAAQEGKTPDEACPYPFGTPDATHWQACWLLAGGKFPE